MSSLLKSPVCRSIFILLCIGMLIVPGCAAESSNKIDLYGLFPTSGTLSSQGEAGMAAFELAVSDINSFLDATGSEIQVTAHVVEMGTDPDSAVAEIAGLQEEGVPLVLTHITSAQLAAALDEINDGDLVLLTSGSSSPSLAIPGDNIIRLNQDDSDEAHVASKYFQENGYTRIVPIVRDDVWGSGLIEEVSASLADGITMDEGVWYEGDPSDFSGYVSLLDQKIGALLASTNPDEVIVYAVTFEELGTIMEEAASGYSNLSKVSWFGSDGNAGIPELTGTSDQAEYALARNFIAIEYAWDPDTKETSVVDTLTAIPGATGYTMGIYDGTWIAFYSLLIAGNEDGSMLKEAVQVTAGKYNGICENYGLDEAGDKFIGIFDLYSLANVGGAVQWKDVAHVGIWGDSADPNNIGIFPIEP